jgi:hypothetical protein
VSLLGSIVNLHSYRLPAFHFDPDPAIDFDADPDPAFIFMRVLIRFHKVMRIRKRKLDETNADPHKLQIVQ